MGLYSDHTLPQFVHELTHHWCFQSPVGHAICLLHLESAKLMLSSRTPDVRRRSRDCILKAEIATQLLSPIAEGMSLFAEFDQMVTTHGKLVSAPLSLVSVLFQQQREYITKIMTRSESPKEAGLADLVETEERLSAAGKEIIAQLLQDPDRFFAAPLFRLRMSSAAIDRKTELLTSPLVFDDDAYLLGYLMIKSTWAWSFSKYWRMFDTDLFLLLLRSFVFGDSSLVEILLDETPCTAATINQLGNHIAHRLFDFINGPVEKFATELEKQNEELVFGHHEPMFKLERCPWEAESIRKAATNSLLNWHRRLAERHGSEIELMFSEMANNLLSQRTSMCICSVEASYELAADGAMVILYRDVPVCAMNTMEMVLPSVGSGRFSVHVIPRTARQFCLFEVDEPRQVLIDEIIPGARASGDDSLDKHDLVRHIKSAENVMNICRDCVEEAKGDSLVDWNDSIGSIRSVAMNTYSQLALSFSKDPVVVHQNMTEDGFWRLFGKDTDAINYLARLSCWSSLCLTRDKLEALCIEQGFALNAATTRLLDLCDVTKFCFFRVDSHGRPISLG
jgi:hypothetical protein